MKDPNSGKAQVRADQILRFAQDDREKDAVLSKPTAIRASWLATAVAWGVHLFTASGAFFGLLAVLAAQRGDYIVSFRWMGLTIIIDSVDGGLARWLRVKERVPRVDGALLDNVVDYFTYSMAPAYFLCVAPIIQEAWRLPAAAAILLASGYQFSRTDAKTEDHAFSGFPSYWNILVFYLFVMGTPSWVNVAVVLACAVMSFLPLRCLYPSRTPHWRKINLILCCLWAAALAVVLFRYPQGYQPWLFGSLAYVVYYCAFSLWMTFKK